MSNVTSNNVIKRTNVPMDQMVFSAKRVFCKVGNRRVEISKEEFMNQFTKEEKKTNLTLKGFDDSIYMGFAENASLGIIAKRSCDRQGNPESIVIFEDVDSIWKRNRFTNKITDC